MYQPIGCYNFDFLSVCICCLKKKLSFHEFIFKIFSVIWLKALFGFLSVFCNDKSRIMLHCCFVPALLLRREMEYREIGYHAGREDLNNKYWDIITND